MNFFAPLLYRATIFNPLSPTEGQYFPDGCLAVERDGIISFCGLTQEAHQLFPDAQIIDLRPHILIPGLVDTHVHLPQYYAAATGNGELLDWLNSSIFPLEAEFRKEDFARTAAQSFFRSALEQGTTAMAVYSSPYYAATDIAFAEAEKAGIRVWMGKTMMDCNVPDALVQNSETNIRLSLALAHTWHGKDNGRLNYVMTPRYGGSCSSALLKQSAEVATAEGLLLQTHLAESKKELEYIASLFPDTHDYTDVYERHGLLSERSILAHCIYLSERELSVLQHHNCGIAHCPTSNRFLRSGIMPADYYLQRGIKLGLGSDIAAGYSLSILREASEAVEMSKLYPFINPDYQQMLTVGEAFYLATLGGARLLHAERRIGNFAKGKEADFVVIDAATAFNPTISLEQPEAVLSRVLYGSNNIKATYIRGKKVAGE